MKNLPKIYLLLIINLITVFSGFAQKFERNYSFSSGGTVEIKNFYGRVEIIAVEENESGDNKMFLQSEAAESNFKIVSNNGNISIETVSNDKTARIDLTLKIPERAHLKIETVGGEVNVSGNFESAEVYTETGTIAADVPLDNLRYNFVWTRSRPRFLSDVELDKVKEKAAGKFVVSGKIIKDSAEEENKETVSEENAEKPKKKQKNETNR